jgi:5'-methylthioadenosine phosphorylase
MTQNHLAIIGGTGLYQLDSLADIQEHAIDTPFGKPSAPIIEGKIADQPVLFLPRHGRSHEFLPHEVNYRANIFALKKLGAQTILSVSATGSLREDFAPGDMALVSQYFDHTRGKRDYSFFGNGVSGHIMPAKPSCPALTNDIIRAAKQHDINLHQDATYACVEGPRLGTRAESFFLKDAAKADLVGMTNVPEAFLAREAQMGYVTLGIVTDYDCWMEDESKHAAMADIFRIYGETINKVKIIIEALGKSNISETPEWIRGAIEHAVMTPQEKLTADQKEWLSVLRA